MYLTGQRKKYISFLIVGIMVFVTLAGAVFSAPVCVYALSLGGLKGTIASLIISLLLQTGVAPTNQTWINQINASYGVESSIGTIEDMITNGLLTETAEGLIDTGLSQAIQNAPAYSLVDDIFTTVATDVGVNQATAAVNLANTAINCGTLGTIGAFAGAAAVGVGVGVLINHVREWITDKVKNSIPMTTPDEVMTNLNQYGGRITTYTGTNNHKRYVYYDDNVFIGKFQNGTYTQVIAVSLDPTNNHVVRYQLQTTNNSVGNINSQTLRPFDSNHPEVINQNTYNMGYTFGDEVNLTDLGDSTTYIHNIGVIRSNGYQAPNGMSPDAVGENGNLTYNNNNQNVPDIRNIVPQNHDMKPVDMDDYQDFIDNANDNTDNGITGEQQGQQFSDFVDPYFIDTENQPIIPDNPSDVPTYPDRPVNPDQPDIPPKTDVTDEDIQQSLEGATTIDLRSVFPFCIPWDIYNLVLIFDTGEDREAPHITFVFPFNENWVVDVDLAEFNSAASVLRLLELIVFIMGLMVATRALIGAKG